MDIGKSIRLARVKRNVSNNDLARLLGVTISTASVMAHRKTAPGATITRLADAFNMKVSEFVALGEEDDE